MPNTIETWIQNMPLASLEMLYSLVGKHIQFRQMNAESAVLEAFKGVTDE
jgi:hypothetical protein